MSTIGSGIFGTTAMGSSMGLSGVFGLAQSGLQAAEAEMNVAANNAANLNTPGYQSQSADLVELSNNGIGDGVSVAGITTDTTPGNPLPSGGSGSTQPSSNVDLAGQVVGMKQAQVLYDANAMVVSVADQMMGTLLDVMDNSNNDNNGN